MGIKSTLSADEIRRRSRLYVSVRWFYVLGIGVPGIIALYVLYGFGPQVRQNVWLVSNVLIINGLFLLLTYIRINSRVVGRAIAAAQIMFDLFLMTLAFIINRGSESPLAMFFAIPIVMTAAFFGRVTIYAVGTAVAINYTVLTLLDYTGKIRILNVAAPQLHTDPQLVFPALVAVVSIILAITAITDLVGRLIREREQLAQQMATLSARNALTEAILRTMGSALVAVNREGRITLVNDVFEKLTGWKRAAVVGRPLDDVLPILDMKGRPVPAAHRPMLQYMSDNHLSQSSVQAVSSFSYIRKDGTTFPFEGNVAPIISHGSVIGFTTVFDDATESRKVNQLKDNFIALISHQLKTPIGEINGYAYNLLGGIGGSLNDKQTEYVTHMQELAARASKLIADLLDIVLAGQGSIAVHNEPTELAPVVKEVLKLRTAQAEKKGLSLDAHIPDELLFIRGDEHTLVQALGNLLDNAIRYTKQGSVRLSVVPADDTIEIYVSDKGTGMDAATLDALFGNSEQAGPLSRAPTAEGGTGLGVYLAKQLIALMHGTIHVVDSSKQGTTIRVTLDRVQPNTS